MTWSFWLPDFLDEIERTGGAALSGTHPVPTRESVAGEFVDAALRAAVRTFGDATPLEARIGPDGYVRIFQVLRVVVAPTDPAREIPLAVVRAASRQLRDHRDGDPLSVPIAYTAIRDGWMDVPSVEDALGAVLPLPTHSDALWEHLTEETNAVLLRYFPAPVFPEGSLGAMLAGGGGWTCGLSARSGDLEIVLERGFFAFYRNRVTSGWVEYGFEILRRGSPSDAPSPSAFRSGDNLGNVQAWCALPTSEAARPAVVRVLQEIADRLVGGSSGSGPTDLHALLASAIRPPEPEGFWAWTQHALPRLLAGHAHRVEHEGDVVSFAITEIWPPAIALGGFGRSGVGLAAVPLTGAFGPEPGGGTVPTGGGSPDALALRGPETDEEVRDLEQIVRTFADWLDAHLDDHVARNGFRDVGSLWYFYGLSGYFPLLQLLEQRLRWGPPGEPPVPPFDEAALERAAERVQPVRSGRSDHVLAAFGIAGWTLTLLDDTDAAPFGSHCGIVLEPPDGGEAVNVMMVDAWNPPARAVVDGDAFAFRRFLGWLREAIVRGGHDEVRSFREEAEDEDDEPVVVLLALSEWLRFGLPDTGDRFLVDWRAQWHVVDAVGRVEDFAGIYGFTGAYVDRLRSYDIPQWRRFLREVIDPRFAQTAGEALGAP